MPHLVAFYCCWRRIDWTELGIATPLTDVALLYVAFDWLGTAEPTTLRGSTYTETMNVWPAAAPLTWMVVVPLALVLVVKFWYVPQLVV